MGMTNLTFACRLRTLLRLSVKNNIVELHENRKKKPLTQATARKPPKIYADKICVSRNIAVKMPLNLFMA